MEHKNLMIDGKFSTEYIYPNKTERWILKDSLQEIASILSSKGFEIRATQCGSGFWAYLEGDMKENKYETEFGTLTRSDGICIEGCETFRHNGTEENVNIDLMVYRWKQSCGSPRGREEKKIRFRIDASENIKNKRADAIIDRYMRFREEA